MNLNIDVAGAKDATAVLQILRLWYGCGKTDVELRFAEYDANQIARLYDAIEKEGIARN